MTRTDSWPHNGDFLVTPRETPFERSRIAVGQALDSDNFVKDAWPILAHELYARRSEDLSQLSATEQAERLSARSYQVLPATELESRLQSSKETGVPLNIKYGIDPTGSDVHLGHAVPMLLLDRMRRMGHTIDFIIGDFTAKIGDPSGRVTSRPVLSDEQIADNMRTYQQQVAPLFDMDNVNVVKNGDWLTTFSLPEMMSVLSKVPIAQTLQRNDFRGRLDSGLTQAEVLYPVVMALDSVHLHTDIELGGKDQLLNMQMGRTLMNLYGMPEQVVLSTDIIEGTDGSGAKMSKSLGNYVGLTQPPQEIFGKIMSIPDTLMEQYYKMLTEIEDSEWTKIATLMQDKKVNPMEIKKLLACDLITVLHGESEALDAKTSFEAQFSKRDYTELDSLPELKADTDDPFTELVSTMRSIRGTTFTRSEARRVMGQGGVKLIDEQGAQTVVASPEALSRSIASARIVKVGKQLLRLV